MRVRALAPLLPLLFSAGCRDDAERQAAELAGLREEAATGIEAIELFCTARDTAIARIERGIPGAERILEEVLLTPVVLDDYCEEFRFHDHGEEADSAVHGDPAPGAEDTTGRGGAG